jgi:hypothetical protein
VAAVVLAVSFTADARRRDAASLPTERRQGSSDGRRAATPPAFYISGECVGAAPADNTLSVCQPPEFHFFSLYRIDFQRPWDPCAAI